MRKSLLIFTCVTFLNLSSQTYSLDKNHASLGFSATHFAVSHVDGRFKSFDASLVSKAADFSDAVIELKADAASIDTDNDKRDADLKSEHWLEVAKYPAITFKSNSLKKESASNYKLSGLITIHGVTKPIVFDVVYNGKATNPMSNKEMIGFTITGKLNREDFNVGSYNFAKVVGKEVDLRSNVEFMVNRESVGTK
jgi:polyisoprenoid-binding protein YceI